jgi:hypothetical protein
VKLYTKEELNSKSDKMFDYLREMLPDVSNEDLTVKRLMQLGRMLAESGEYKAAAGYQIDQIIHGEISKAIDTAMGDKVSASMMNQYVKSACKEWNYLQAAFDRINSAAGKQIMALQTLISYEKEKMKIL